MKKCLITGARGMLGSKAVQLLSKNYDVLGVDIDNFDITKKNETISSIKDFNPDIILHSAAYTAVDQAEEEQDKCFLINETGSENVALAAKETNAIVVYYSTDYVFKGDSENAYLESDPTDPIGVYGASKLAGEKKIAEILDKYFILRITWLFGEGGKNFPQTMLNLAKTKDLLNVVSDQFGSPTYTEDVVKQTEEVLKTDAYGIFHSSSEGLCTWYELAKKTFELAGIEIKVNPVTSDEYPSKAKRPKYSYLENKRLKELGINVMPFWESAIERYVSGIK